MKNSQVHWYEGLFLRPHHFQAADRYWTEYLHTSQAWDTAYNYGLHAIKISEEALANHHFQIDFVQAKMPDGTIVDLHDGKEPDRIPIKDAVEEFQSISANLEDGLEQASVLRVYLAIPKLTMGRANVADQNGGVRFAEKTSNVDDESWGDNFQELQLKDVNVKLLLSTQDLSGHELLPIAQVKRAGEGEAKPQLDRSYIPPVMSIQAWPGLAKDMVRALFDVINQKIDVLSQQLINRGIGLEIRDSGDGERVMMLTQLNSALGALSVLTFAENTHPLLAYRELCRIYGQLSVFGPQRRPEEVPAYDHEDLGNIFAQIKFRIEALINAVQDYQYHQRYFVGVGLGMQATLEPRWFNSDWQWYIGVSKGDLNEKELRELLSPGQLDWKFGSSRQVEYLFRHRAAGLDIHPLDRTVRSLPMSQDWVYYEIPRIDSPAWRDVQETQTLALRMKDSLIMNLDRLQGEKQLVVSALGRSVTLQFALFAVPTTK